MEYDKILETLRRCRKWMNYKCVWKTSELTDPVTKSKVQVIALGPVRFNINYEDQPEVKKMRVEKEKVSGKKLTKKEVFWEHLDKDIYPSSLIVHKNDSTLDDSNPIKRWYVQCFPAYKPMGRGHKGEKERILPTIRYLIDGKLIPQTDPRIEKWEELRKKKDIPSYGWVKSIKDILVIAKKVKVKGGK